MNGFNLIIGGKPRYIIALFLVLGGFILLAFASFKPSADPDVIRKTMDAGHSFAFILLSGLLYLAMEHHGKWQATMVSGLFSVLLMVGIEGLQPYFGRTASLADIQLSLLGTFIALSGMLVWRTVKNSLLKMMSLFLLVLAVGWIVQPVWSEWRSLWWREQQFPLLGDFEHKLETKLWSAHGQHTRVSLSDQHAVSGLHSLQVEINKGVWLGVRYAAGDQDWRKYKTLTMTFYNPGTAFNMNLRIDDGVNAFPKYSERYNGEFQIGEGATTLLIPLANIAASPKSRLLDLSRIRKMILFLSKNEKPRLFYLDSVRLI
ncbi:MAG: hypothetical protein GXP14_08220 [Gammaproteobacteria bacterium]|nr:hypothetical protein [Gammaproteobacteria bacterium]